MKIAVIIFVAALFSAIAFIHGGPNNVCSQVTKGSIVAVANCPARIHEMVWSF